MTPHKNEQQQQQQEQPPLDSSDPADTTALPCACPCLQRWTIDAIDKHRVKLKRAAGGRQRRRQPPTAGTAVVVVVVEGASANTSCHQDSPKDADVNDQEATVMIGVRPTTTTKSTSTVHARNHSTVPYRPPGGRHSLSSSSSSSSLSFSSHRIPCVCDWNPFCLVTLGGAMNDVLQQRQRQQQQRQRQHCPVVRSDRKQGPTPTTIRGNGPTQEAEEEVVVVEEDKDEVDTNQNNNSNTSNHTNNSNNNNNSDDEEKEEEDNDVILVEESRPSSIATADQAIYRPETLGKLQRLRKVVQVPVSELSRYLQDTLQGLSQSIWPLSQCLDILRYHHQQLHFPIQDPTIQAILSGDKNNHNHDHDGDDCQSLLAMAMPPGIQNLGATCYLNTQLQCLAQNPVFLEGIFAWQRQPRRHGISDQSDQDSSPAVASSQQQQQQQHDRMNSVLGLFQELLARMNAGHENTVNALDFSNALGLDHFEQQDPNEFSRLFLEKIHSSFQECSSHGNHQNHHSNTHATTTTTTTTTTTNGNPETTSSRNLAMLLPELFQGKMAYETTCMKCKNTSRRVEEFMDLNLPIVHPSEEDEPGTTTTSATSSEAPSSSSSSKKTGQQTVLELFTKRDTDVQYCLDRYCKPELLNGENQYYCSVCQAKQDAERAPAMVRLPPVLNVQLSRYVYDRVKFMKKKLADPVLLPLELELHETKLKEDGHNDKNEHDKDSYSATSAAAPLGDIPRRYLLCAVMRHQGTSAYSGHYIAEAMDWLTGQWFEFNDEKVTRLEEGPSCSFDPRTISTTPTTTTTQQAGKGTSVDVTPKRAGKKQKASALIGSKDAYNMYYVEENFLAQSILENLRTKQEAMERAPRNYYKYPINIVEQAAMDRAEKYETVERCV